MPTSRSYHDACPIARALDVIGERWALLVVRELLFGPQRFSDLRRALAGASSNLVADRLRELQERGVVGRHRLPPPASAWVYTLTDAGRRLEPILLAMGEWGAHVPPPPGPTTLSAASVLLYLRTTSRPAADAPPASLRLDLDGAVWTVNVADGNIDIQSGATGPGDAQLTTTPATFLALLEHPERLETITDGSVVVGGDVPAWRRVLESVAGGKPRRGSG